MDEPTAVLGVKESNMVLDLIRRIRDIGLPVILINHNMPHVFDIADRPIKVPMNTYKKLRKRRPCPATSSATPAAVVSFANSTGNDVID